MTKVKICGITRLEDAHFCAELGVEYLGFVFVRESARFVEAEWVGGILRPSGEEGTLIRPSATFSPAGEKGNKHGPRDGYLVARGDDLKPPRAARHVARRADEGPLRVGVFRDSPLEDVRRIAGIARLDVIQLHGHEDEEYVRAIDLPVIKVVQGSETTSAPFVMFDSGGGSGRTFDWSLVERHRPPQPFFLAGGLTPDNVAEAMRVTRPYAVDVSTGVESAPGIKDHQKIREFVQKVRQP